MLWSHLIVKDSSNQTRGGGSRGVQLRSRDLWRTDGRRLAPGRKISPTRTWLVCDLFRNYLRHCSNISVAPYHAEPTYSQWPFLSFLHLPPPSWPAAVQPCRFTNRQSIESWQWFFSLSHGKYITLKLTIYYLRRSPITCFVNLVLTDFVERYKKKVSRTLKKLPRPNIAHAYFSYLNRAENCLIGSCWQGHKLMSTKHS